MDKHLSASSIESEVDRVEHAKTGTRLANELAAAGAAYLAHMGTGGGIAAIPGTDPQQYVVAGTLAVIGQVLQQDAGTAAQAVRLTEDEITTIWQTMPGGPAGWLKSFGFLQFARAVEEEVIERQSPAPVPEQAPFSAENAAVIAHQVGEWTKERDRLQDLIDTATGKAGAPIPEQVVQASTLTEAQRKAISRAAECVESYGRDDLAIVLREVLTTQSAKQGAQPNMILVPKWAGEFATFQQWVNTAQRVLSVPDHKPKAICVDAKGRRCHIGADMARARDESAFPVRYFWECELSAPAQAPVEQATGAKEGAQLPPITPKHIEEISDILLWPVTEDDARTARDMLQSLHFDLSMAEPVGAPASLEEVRNQAPNMDAAQLAELILADPDGGYMRISSELESCTDGSMRFTVTNPDTGRRFGIHIGLTELLEGERIDRASTAGAEGADHA